MGGVGICSRLVDGEGVLLAKNVTEETDHGSSVVSWSSINVKGMLRVLIVSVEWSG
jgi:hypothetical protein